MQAIEKGLWSSQIGNATVYVLETEDSIALAHSRDLVGEEKRKLMKRVARQYFLKFARFFRSLDHFSWVLIERGGRFVAPTDDEMLAWWGGPRPISRLEMKRDLDQKKECSWRGRFVWGLEDLLARRDRNWVVGETCLASGTTLYTLVSAALDVYPQPSLRHVILVCPVVGSYGLRRLIKLCSANNIALTVYTSGIWWVNSEGYDSGLPFTDFVINDEPDPDNLQFVPPKTKSVYQQQYRGKPVCVVGDAGDSMAVRDDGLEDNKAQFNYMRDTVKGFKNLGLDPHKYFPSWPLNELILAVA
ncbi:MAG: hypothetical protein GF349_01545 [Candidatus Magasanikbacteria bacterium]|nr:hypothetical protein [Candidatus Magasanikbacteria bacterium]